MSHCTSAASPIVRRADASDADAVVHLLRMRDDRPHPADAVTAYLMNLDPGRLLAWIARVADRPVGLNALYLRRVCFGGEAYRAGYWAHLFVDPAFRKTMVYPQLVFAMLRAAREASIDLIYTATRRKHVAESHTKLGFRLLGTLQVPFKPLRPMRLLAKHKNLASIVDMMGRPLDAIYIGQAALRRPACPLGLTIEKLPIDVSNVDPIVDLLKQESAGSFCQDWTVAGFRRRFATTIEGQPYTILLARKAAQVEVAAVIRLAERGPRRVRAGVVLDLTGSARAPEAARSVLAEAERWATAHGAELMLSLDGAGQAPRNAFRALGYRTSPETYYVLGWSTEHFNEGSGAADLHDWRFTFADHDAF